MNILGFPFGELEEIYKSCSIESFEFYGKNVLLIGGSGFLGSAIKAYLVFLNQFKFKKPCEIVSLDKYVGRNKPIEQNLLNLKHLEKDIVEGFTEDFFFGQKIDYIINCSGNASPQNYVAHSLETISVSVDGTRNVLDLAKQHGSKVLNFSSSEVLGTPVDKDVPTGEGVFASIHPFNQRACYDSSKLMLETLSWIYKTQENVDVKLVRLFNCVGRFRQDDYRVFPNFISQALKGEDIKVFAPGTQTRTFSYYTDVISGCLKVLTRGESILYHIGNNQNEISMFNFAKLIEKECGKNNIVKLVTTPSSYTFEPKRRCPDISLAINELGYSPKIDVQEMVRRIVEWAKVSYIY